MKDKRQKKEFNYLKKYMQLTKPKFWPCVLHTILYSAYVCMQLLDALFAANAVTGLTKGDWGYAYKNVAFLALFTIIRNVTAHLFNRHRAKLYADGYNNITSKLYKKILYANSENFEQTSKEYILNTIGTNVGTMASFSSEVIKKIGIVIQLIVALTVIFSASVLSGFIVFGLAFVDFFLLRFLNRKYAMALNKQYKARDAIYEDVSDVIDGHGIINEFDKEKEFERRFAKKTNAFNLGIKDEYVWASYKSDFFYTFYRVVICAINLLLVFMVSKDTMSLSVYMVVVAYLLTCTEQFNSVFDITQLLSNLEVSVKRVDVVANFTDEQFAAYGNILRSHGGQNLSFVGVNYFNADAKSAYCGKLVDLDLSFMPNAINLVKGPRKCGKRLVFNMLRRNIRPDSGCVIYDNINLYDYSQKDFKQKIYYSTRNPDFVAGTIKENLALTGAKNKKITAVCKQLGIYDYIKELPKGFDSEIEDDMPRMFKFLLGLARALLTDCEVLLIYETPSAMSKTDKLLLQKLFGELAKERTIILFTYGDLYDNVAKICYKIEQGQLADVKVN